MQQYSRHLDLARVRGSDAGAKLSGEIRLRIPPLLRIPPHHYSAFGNDGGVFLFSVLGRRPRKFCYFIRGDPYENRAEGAIFFWGVTSGIKNPPVIMNTPPSLFRHLVMMGGVLLIGSPLMWELDVGRKYIIISTHQEAAPPSQVTDRRSCS